MRKIYNVTVEGILPFRCDIPVIADSEEEARSYVETDGISLQQAAEGLNGVGPYSITKVEFVSAEEEENGYQT